jgi:hypothetical protein
MRSAIFRWNYDRLGGRAQVAQNQQRGLAILKKIPRDRWIVRVKPGHIALPKHTIPLAHGDHVFDGM